MQLGRFTLAKGASLAPMAGATDTTMRRLCAAHGAVCTVSEMVSAKALTMGDKKSPRLMAGGGGDAPFGVQLFGAQPDVMAEAARLICDMRGKMPFDFIDINMGCPVPKVVNNGDGSALMRNPLLAGKIIEKTAKAIKKPVTVKIRKGFDDDHINAVEMAHIAEESGAAAIAVHGRTREQFYSGKADWDIIRQVKEAVKIPVIGNGDVTSAESADAIMRETGCDGVMIGRGAQGNPWIFHELQEYERTGVVPPRPTPEKIKETMLRHAKLQIEFKGDFIGIREMRKHVAWYTKGMKGSAKLRDAINQVESYEELEVLLDKAIV